MVDQSINCTTEEIKYNDSLCLVQIHHPINSGIMKIDCVKKICETSTPKKDNREYKFEYIQKDDLKQFDCVI